MNLPVCLLIFFLFSIYELMSIDVISTNITIMKRLLLYLWWNMSYSSVGTPVDLPLVAEILTGIWRDSIRLYQYLHWGSNLGVAFACNSWLLLWIVFVYMCLSWEFRAQCIKLFISVIRTKTFPRCCAKKITNNPAVNCNATHLARPHAERNK